MKENQLREFLTEHEAGVLEQIFDIRKDMIESMTEEGIPKSTKDIRILNESIKGLEEHVKMRNDMRLEKTEADNIEDVKKFVLEIAKSQSVNELMQNDGVYLSDSLPDDLMPSDDDFVEGQLDMDQQKFGLDEITSSIDLEDE